MINPLKSRSFFIFGARGTGKTTLLKQLFPENCFWIDLLDKDIEAKLQRRPMALLDWLKPVKEKPSVPWVVIDEIQKIPALLDVIHLEIENKQLFFAMTGSSARKLKRGAADLLGGRALENHLFPLTTEELADRFDLDFVMRWGSLPEVFFMDELTRSEYLKTWVNTYLREEIQIEQLVRKIAPFRAFLEVAAQCSGSIVNYSKIARDIDSDPVSVQNYFSILEDTLVGYFLPPFHRSLRKRQRKHPKFYFFDTGVKNTLQRTLSHVAEPGTYPYGVAFEHWIVSEFFRLNHYLLRDWPISYLRTKDDAEVDLVVERDRGPLLFVEIKSTAHLHREDLTTFLRLSRDFPEAQCCCLSNDQTRMKIEQVDCLPWHEGIREIFDL